MTNSKSKRHAITNTKMIVSGQLIKYYELVSIIENKSFYVDLKKALDSHFEVLVMATMSSGKSTLINAMLGFDLLPTANEACTATIYRLEDNDNEKEIKCRASLEDIITNWQPATAELLKEWNQTDRCSLVEISGNMPYISNAGAQLVLYDTPGPNYSCDHRHADILTKVLNNRKYGVIVCLLNATCLGTDDEKRMLDQILSIMKQEEEYKKKTVFIISKADEFDNDKGEDLGKIVKKIRAYLTGRGFAKPMIIPIMAKAALLLRKLSQGMELTMREQLDINGIIQKIHAAPDNVLNATSIEKSIKQEIKRGISGIGHEVSEAKIKEGVFTYDDGFSISSKDLNSVIYSTGIHTLESYFEHLIITEALPETMNRISLVFKKHNIQHIFK